MAPDIRIEGLGEVSKAWRATWNDRALLRRQDREQIPSRENPTLAHETCPRSAVKGELAAAHTNCFSQANWNKGSRSEETSRALWKWRGPGVEVSSARVRECSVSVVANLQTKNPRGKNL